MLKGDPLVFLLFLWLLLMLLFLNTVLMGAEVATWTIASWPVCSEGLVLLLLIWLRKVKKKKMKKWPQNPSLIQMRQWKIIPVSNHVLDRVWSHDLASCCRCST